MNLFDIIDNMQIIESPQKELETKAVEIIEDRISKTLKTKGKFVLAVAGGSSVVGIFEQLQNAEIDWSKVHFILADERAVELTDDQSNFKNLQDNLISHIEIPEQNVHSLDISEGFAPALVSYQKQFEDLGGEVDLALLGAGEDGHIASLFPNHPSVQDDATGYIKVIGSPKPPSNRISLSRKTIAEAKTAILLFFGKNKFDAFQDFNNPLLSEQECPAQIVAEIEDSFILADI